jgi:hypothetical protein
MQAKQQVMQIKQWIDAAGDASKAASKAKVIGLQREEAAAAAAEDASKAASNASKAVDRSAACAGAGRGQTLAHAGRFYAIEALASKSTTRRERARQRRSS